MTPLATPPFSAPLSLPPDGMGERIGRGKVRKLMGRDKDSFIRKAKAAQVSAAKEGILSPLPRGTQLLSQLQESRVLWCHCMSW